MTTQKTKPTAWRPKKGQWFNAYLKRYNKLHPAGPFKCECFAGTHQFVKASDSEGDSLEFQLRFFRLEPVQRKKTE